jgi:hypothetical protein
MKTKLKEFIDKSPDTYFTFESVHYKLHLNSGREYLSLFGQNASRPDVIISKDNQIDDLEIKHEPNKKLVIIYRKGIEFINFEYLSRFTFNLELSKNYR